MTPVCGIFSPFHQTRCAATGIDLGAFTKCYRVQLATLENSSLDDPRTACETDLFVTAANVKSIELAEAVRGAIDGDRAVAAGIEDAKFAALGEIAGFERVVGGQQQRFCERDRRADHGAVEVNVSETDDSGLKEVGYEECLTQLLRGHGAIADWIRHMHDLHDLPLFLSVQMQAVRCELEKLPWPA